MATDALTTGTGPAPSRRSPWRRLLRNPRSLSALALLAGILAMALCANLVAPFSYRDQSRGCEKRPPGAEFWMGTDDLGRDVLSRVLYGAQVSLAVGVSATLLATVIGVTAGLLCGYFGGRLDAVIMRFTDTVAAFPSLLLAVAITAVYDRPHQSVAEKILVMVAALGIVGWTGIARVVRAQAMTVRSYDFVVAAQALGAGHRRLLLIHILPNCLSPILILATLAIGGNVLSEAGLSFLGLGVPAPFPSWGGMLSTAQSYLPEGHWWMAVFPGLCIVATVLGFNLLGDGLRDAFDPRSVE